MYLHDSGISTDIIFDCSKADYPIDDNLSDKDIDYIDDLQKALSFIVLILLQSILIRLQVYAKQYEGISVK